ncbi:MAG: tetratricopeptide repeat protein [Elusimicrobiaceae bacterium]|nr:tetratricopeptide repeat protein [Elusimicrobiaceae bacterium]
MGRMPGRRFFLAVPAALLMLGCGCVSGPRREESELRAGKNSYLAGNYIYAAAEFDRIIATRPDSDIEAGAYIGLGASYEALHNYGEALTTYRLAVQLHPKSSQLLLRLGALYYKLALYPQSLAVYTTALKLDPENVTANLGIARTYMKTGYLVSAARHYKSAIDSSGGNYGMRYAYSDCLFRQRNLLGAETEALNALSLNRADPDIWFLLARIQFEHGNQEAALRSIESASALSGGRSDIESFRLMWLSQFGKLELAVPLADTLIGKYPDDALIKWTAGLVYLKAGQRDKARVTLAELAGSRDDTFISRSAGRLLEAAGLAQKH